ncbi:MAG: glutaredoxin family protein [Candidatus Methanomethylicota archaeon]|uniref:Glutaredoxin family protein n=1 Tax=Thermoproteota archaeon TaxID=2056631 RepID=A0A523BBY5_9CREN|nr:MAG: glutaredoxin family protein [Candidatus Verstraetearchaeota archaeon]
MKIQRVSGNNKKHKVFVYTLSTCAWCKKTKQFLKDKDVEYEYVDVDLLSKEDLEKVKAEIASRGAQLLFPLIVIDDKVIITGFREDQISGALA